ncbi:P-loop containing nucleoside triphosphate hydrolase protein [Abortiporus biennis]|nr:P-loop containing nucleoside triphosphate hydrolase protein [Abortiporus biennis]
MEEVARELASHLFQRLSTSSGGERLLVGISGVPASGKSTLAQTIVDKINHSHSTNDNTEEIAILVGLDGWHLTRAQLDQFPDPKLAHDRRGAHWTFDGSSYLSFIRSLRQPTSPDSEAITAPTFSHSIKDPTPHAISIFPIHRIVVIEGLYTFLSIEPWKEAGELLNERWWVEIGEDEAEKRLVKRHVESGVAKDWDEAVWRARENDRPNGRFIKENMLTPTRTIVSVEDPVLAPIPPEHIEIPNTTC